MFDILINKLRIKNNKLVGKIYNLKAKLNGEIPVTREELLYLVNSWGRSTGFYTKDSKNKDIYIESCETKECYDLSKLDTSQITDMRDLFLCSQFNDIHSKNGIGLHNGDISSWDVSNVTNMSYMFRYAESFNQTIGNWDVSNVKEMIHMFSHAKLFNQNISNWNLKNLINSYGVFYEAKAFNKKYNKNQEPLLYANQLKKWFNDNNVKMTEIDIKDNYSQELNNFFQDIYKKKNLELKEKVILQEEEKEENFVNVFNEFGFKIS